MLSVYENLLAREACYYLQWRFPAVQYSYDLEMPGGNVRFWGRGEFSHVKRIQEEDAADRFSSSLWQRAEVGSNSRDRGCAFRPVPKDPIAEDNGDEPLRPARGILIGLLVSLVFWLIVGVLLVIWLRH